MLPCVSAAYDQITEPRNAQPLALVFIVMEVIIERCATKQMHQQCLLHTVDIKVRILIPDSKIIVHLIQVRQVIFRMTLFPCLIPLPNYKGPQDMVMVQGSNT